MKFHALLQEITVSQIFGPVLAYVWRVEWQVMRHISRAVQPV
jgi:hypothetical protein